MAYYSFYKIIKDIIRTIFGNKFLKYLFIFIIVFLIYTIFLKGTSYGAYSFDIQFDNGTSTTLTLPQWVENDNYYYLFFYDSRPQDLFWFGYVFSTTPITFTGFSNGTLKGNFVYNYYQAGRSTFLSTLKPEIENMSKPTSYLTTGYTASWWFSSDTTYFCNHDIVNTTTNTTVFTNNSVPPFIAPFITTPATAFQNLTFSRLLIEAGSLTSSETFYLHRLEITDTMTDGNITYYYYSDKTFPLDINSKYYKQFLDTDGFYYSIPKYEFNFATDKQYLFVLDNSAEQYNNSVGLIDTSFNGVYHVYSLDTTGLYSSADVTNDNLDEINENLDETKTFEDTLLSDEFDEDLPNDTLNSLGGGFRDSVDDTQYVGLFSTIFQKLGTIFNGDYDSIEEIKIYLPHSNNKYISLRSDLLKNFIYNEQFTTLYDLVQIFWLYIFGVYVFSFSYSIIRAIKSGSLLGGYSWENEAITSTML